MRRIDLKKVNVARSNTIRNINRQIVLNYVRERAPISRAEIAQETALQRSTVSLIVDELKARGLIEEVEGESTGGRPPTLLRLRAAAADVPRCRRGPRRPGVRKVGSGARKQGQRRLLPRIGRSPRQPTNGSLFDPSVRVSVSDSARQRACVRQFLPPRRIARAWPAARPCRAR